MQRAHPTFCALLLVCAACSAGRDPSPPSSTGPTTGDATGDDRGSNTGGTTSGSGSSGQAMNSGTGGDDNGSTTRGPDMPGLETRPVNSACVAPERPQPASSVTLQRAFASLTFDRPLGMFQPPDDSSHWYVIEQGGRVLRFENRTGVSSASEVLSVSVSNGGGNDERGLLGLAFHPDFATNAYVYLSYITSQGGSQRTRIERYTSTNGGASFGSPQVILEHPQPAFNHNGGNIAFGPDDYFYLGLGDGGGGNDTFGNGQNTDTLLGAMLRIDVDGGTPYAIPPDNPFADGGGAPEIYAWGLRNPWRWSFDALTGELWVGDVGQDCYEEIDLVERGDNLGWPELEGFTCFASNNDDNGCPDTRSCDAASDSQYTAPVFMYPQSDGVSVTGGYVYRGSRIPALEGTYLFADFASGKIWGTRRQQDGSFETEELLDSDAAIASFAQGPDHELYVLDRGSGGIFSIEAGADTPVDTLPGKLSETGCVDPDNPTRVAEGVLPYDLRVPFWSDGATKERYLALPEEATLQVDASGDWMLPPGGVTMKTFWLDDRRVETRFFVRHPDGSFSGYTYEWNQAQTEATLLDSRKTANVSGESWYFPSRGECVGCHTAAAGYSLGLESRQLDKAFDYPGGSLGNQIATLNHIGLFATEQSPPSTPLAELNDTSAPLEARAKAYLHVNCSQCHQPGAPGRGTADLRIDAESPGICDVPPTAGDLDIEGARLLVPGDPDRSLLTVRTATRGPAAMPPVASNEVDEGGTTLLQEWVQSLTACP